MAIERDREVYERDSSASGVLMGVLVVAVIAVLIWLAYNQGIFRNAGVPNTGDNTSVDINATLPGTGTDGTYGTGTGGTSR